MKRAAATIWSNASRCAREAGLDGLVAAALVNLGSAHAKIHQFARAERYLRDAIAFATEREEDNWRPSSVVWLAQTRLAQGDWTKRADLAAAALRLPAVPVPASAPPDPRSGTLPVGLPAIVRMRALVTLGRIRARRGDPDAEALFAEALALVGSEATFRYVAPIRAARAEAAGWRAIPHGRPLRRRRRSTRRPGISKPGSRANWRSGGGAPARPWLHRPACRRRSPWRWPGIGPPPPRPGTRSAAPTKRRSRCWTATSRRCGARSPASTASARDRRPRSRRGACVNAASTAFLGDHARPPAPIPPASPTASSRSCRCSPPGSRTAAIAARLFLSPKTVEHHLGRIFAKLDVHARGDVAAAAVRLGVALGPGQDREPAPPK